MNSSSDASCSSKKFESEADIEERKKRRQEEWEKVRKPEDPVEAPEVPYDPRSLYDQLQEQKDKKQAEFEESHRLKNLIKGLDDDEVAFLELIDKTKMDMETKLWNEERKEIDEFTKAVANLSEEESEARRTEFRKTLRLPAQGTAKKSQQELLGASIKRKAANGDTNAEKKLCSGADLGHDQKSATNKGPEDDSVNVSANAIPVRTGLPTLQCLGILPGLGAYTDSSDSDNSSNSDIEKDCDFDLIGRKKIIVTEKEVTVPKG